jgi:opacity protein-like surface antigen
MPSFVAVTVAALLAASAADLDTVFLNNGGRVRGTVVEEDPARGVIIQMPGGDQRTLQPGEVYRIQYGDGTVKTYGGRQEPAPSAPPPPPAAAELPATAPPPPPMPPASDRAPSVESQPAAGVPVAAGPVAPPDPYGPPAPVTFAVSLFRLLPGGDTEAGRTMKDFTTPMTGFGLEAGLRFTPKFLMGGFLDMAFGEAGPGLEAWCTASGFQCTTADVKMGLMARYSFTPLRSNTPWIGAGVAFGVLMALSNATDNTPSYGGGELLRLSAGWDLRLNRTIGAGIFVTGSTSRYPDVDRGPGEIVSIDHRARHTWLQIGLRGILFP